MEGMQPKTEEFLNLLLWSADQLMRPTFRNLTESYEGWCYRQGLLRQASALERCRLLERTPGAESDRLYRLTEQGRIHALGGRDPVAYWSRVWDGKWRLVLFDLPMDRHVQRGRLRRYLRSRGFGYLQGSVWITPDKITDEPAILSGSGVDVESLLLLEARPCGGESDDQIVAGAWDFDGINRLYARHLEMLDRFPESKLTTSATANAFQRWAREERAAWRVAMEMDPLLPQALLPGNYLGRRAWQKRVEISRRAKRQLQSFVFES